MSKPSPSRPLRLKRTHLLSKDQASPQSIMTLSAALPAPGDSDWPRTIVVTEEFPTELLIGRARLAKHLRLLPNRTIATYRVAPPTEADAEAIRALDGWTTLAQFGAGITALHAAGMPLSQIREVVQGAGHTSDLSRTIAMFRQSPELFDQADQSRGKLTLSHLLAIGRIAPEARDAVARDVLQKGLSVRGLRKRIARRSAPVDADLQSLASELGSALNTDVAVTGTGEKGEVRLAWDGVEELQGLFQRLGRTGTHGTPLPCPGLDREPLPATSRRWLVITYTSYREFEELFGHLLGPDSGFG